MDGDRRSCRSSPRSRRAATRTSYKVAGGARRQGPGGSLTFAQAAEARDQARRQVRRPRAAGEHQRDDQGLGGAVLAGQGLMGVARDNYPRDGSTYSFVAGFAEVEVDVETGIYQHRRLPRRRGCRHGAPPARLGGQIHGGAVQGFGTRAQPAAGLRHALRRRRSRSGCITTSRRRFSTFRSR